MDDEPTHYLDHLRELHGVDAVRYSSTTKGAVEPLVELQIQGENHIFAVVEFRSHLSPATADQLVENRAISRTPILVLAPRIGGRVAEALTAARINYVDRNGNVHVEVGSVHIHIEGRTGPSLPAMDKAIRSAGYQVLFAYLADPELINHSLRHVGELVGVSHQAASDMRRRLIEQELIVKTKSKFQWVQHRRIDALNLWLHGYQSTVRPGLMWSAWRTQDATPSQLEERLKVAFTNAGVSEFRWGGCAAGFRFHPHFRGERTVVHVHATPRDLRSTLNASTDPNGNLILIDAFGELNWNYPQEQVVHPLLVYSEMLADPDERAREAARLFFDQEIRPLWN